MQLGARPLNSIDLLAHKTKETKTVRRAFVVWDPSRGNVSSFGIAITLVGGLLWLVLFAGSAVLLNILGTGLVDGFDQFNLCLFELHGGIIAITDRLVELGCVASDPHMLDSIWKHGAKASLVEIIGGHIGEEDGARGDAASVVGVIEEGIAQVDVEDDFAGNHVHDKAVNSPADENVGVVVVLVCDIVDVAERQDVQLRAVSSSSSIYWEEDWPGDAATNKGYDGAYFNVANEKVPINALVPERSRIGEFPKGTDPVEPAVGQRRGLFSRSEM